MIENISKDENRAIEQLKHFVNEPRRIVRENEIYKIASKEHIFGEEHGKIILNLIKKQNKEIQHWKKELEKVLTENNLIG